MGFTLLLQWSISLPVGRAVSLADVVCARVLENYGHNPPSRLGLQLRTYRAQFPLSPTTDDNNQDNNNQISRYLTIISNLMPPAQPGEVRTNSPIFKDDTAYLFLDDRSSTAIGGESEHVNRAIETSTVAHSSDIVSLQQDGEGERFRCVAVRPPTAVIPMLQSLLNPFVMGLTKAARTTASQTSSTPVPTSLPGSTLLMTVLTFNALPSPLPPVILRLYILPNQSASSIFLEGEYEGIADGKSEEEMEEEVKKYLESCLITDLLGERRWIDCSRGHENWRAWNNAERNKYAMLTLAKTLRQGNFI
ncbi:hypothetical protein C343_00447 [Cryptococcus neoformans C23]|uniref:Uncharacterized protein n=2 Tax=Cryptococcus neoformans TaxID=5207 RepID=A0A854QKG5_CRYNE|nr:hypothetical protein CNAG_00438 [Cryptococcus neoformans var. grubii H99]AUB22014.1 hypothetical protein CKF44_00438 [Cryptococcus neoformans var. grubii]OWZ36357.1 hypothetical protein C347_00525 [Cryptococcus neoformans var. grubii AD2-60a]OWZ48024.1 hypothetical protein C343_00447 [Cryptococcus neoformans var. grubii C23]OWZ56997.1 hypothetical protein C353_00455 [Cryptococcus neoformans var. grubii AD1-83a]OWZ58288.1 hypothetical protein C368_00446 [Cryptococcus neoformans var. grubii 1|eukprot:XP_012046715.1 hypothetical protein CNAG_00438 [Cryptococcus neoformans var. grubii H99]